MNAYWEDLFRGWAGDELAFADAVIDGLPPAFYKAQSSVTGKYHPQDEIAPGGLALHSWRMAKLMPEMARMFSDAINPRPLVLAAIVHDAFKPTLTKETYWRHPLVSALHILAAQPDLSIPWRLQCAYACATHEGRWTDPRIFAELGDRLDGFMETPRWIAEPFHAADYVLSRRSTWEVFTSPKLYKEVLDGNGVV
jgi:hypothetical protein